MTESRLVIHAIPCHTLPENRYSAPLPSSHSNHQQSRTSIEAGSAAIDGTKPRNTHSTPTSHPLTHQQQGNTSSNNATLSNTTSATTIRETNENMLDLNSSTPQQRPLAANATNGSPDDQSSPRSNGVLSDDTEEDVFDDAMDDILGQVDHMSITDQTGNEQK